MKIQVMVFWVVKPCSNVAQYQVFKGLHCLHLYTLVSYHVTTWRNNPEDHNLTNKHDSYIYLRNLHSTS